MLEKYTKSQLKAITTSGENILVSAGAGSGKTGVLQERVIYKLRQGIHIDDLIILTFTNAAASEMKSRIIDSINKNDLIKNELSRIDQAVISTFDSFCLKLVKEYYYLLNLPKTIKIGDNIQFLIMEKAVLEEVIKSYYLKNDQVFNDMAILLFQKNDSIIHETVKDLAHNLLKEPNYEEKISNFETVYFSKSKLEDDFNSFYLLQIKKIKHAYEIYQELENKLANYSPKADEYLNRLELYIESLIDCNFDLFCNNLLNEKFPRKLSSRNDDYLKSLLDEYHNNIKTIIDKVKKTIKELNVSSKIEAINRVESTKEVVLKMVEIAKTYIKVLNNKKKSLALYSFQDIMALAIKLLEENKDIREYYQNKVVEIMIDEYQDTNDLQDYFVSLIAKNNLFMVGDIKQSIYRFRDANPQNFLKKYFDYQKHKKGILINLTENFRSREEVLSDINKTFYKVMDNEIGGINYQDGQSLIYGLKSYNKKAQNQRYGIDLITYDYPEIKENNQSIDKIQIEAELLAKDINNRMKNQLILDTFTGKFRKMEFSDISILIDRKTDFLALTKVLSRFSIPINIFSEEPFIESKEIIFLVNYLKFVYAFINIDYLQKNFKKLLYGVSRSFVFKIRDEDIIHFLVTEEITSLNDLKKLTRVFEFKQLYSITKEISELIDLLPIYDILMIIYQKLDIYRMISYLENPKNKEGKLDFFASTIKGFELYTFADLISYIEAIEKNKDWDINYSHQENDVDAVKLMTMHKSKGLQFPVVYFPFLYKQFNISENKKFFVYDKNYGLITDAFDQGFNRTFLRHLSLYNIKKEMISERIRLLYVAFTRAKENMILFADINDLKELRQGNGKYIDTEIRLNYNKYTDILCSTDIRNYNYGNKPLQEKFSAKNIFKPNEDNKLIFKSFNFQEQIIEETQYSSFKPKLLSDDDIVKTNYGEYIHELLENINFNDLENSLKLLPTNLRISIEKLLKTNLFHFEKHPKVFQEYEFYQKTDKIYKRGIIDLIVEYNDIIYIIDYKLKKLDNLAYLKQLAGYKTYIANLTNKTVKTYLYSILDKLLTEV